MKTIWGSAVLILGLATSAFGSQESANCRYEMRNKVYSKDGVQTVTGEAVPNLDVFYDTGAPWPREPALNCASDNTARSRAVTGRPFCMGRVICGSGQSEKTFMVICPAVPSSSQLKDYACPEAQGCFDQSVLPKTGAAQSVQLAQKSGTPAKRPQASGAKKAAAPVQKAATPAHSTPAKKK